MTTTKELGWLIDAATHAWEKAPDTRRSVPFTHRGVDYLVVRGKKRLIIKTPEGEDIAEDRMLAPGDFLSRWLTKDIKKAPPR